MDFQEFKRRMLQQKGDVPITLTDEDLFKLYLSHVVMETYVREKEREFRKRTKERGYE